MGPGQDLHGFGHLGVAGNRPVVVAVGAGQLGEHPGVTGIGLRARGRVPLAVARRRHRVDRQHRVAGRDQRADEQAAVGLGGHDHLRWISDVGCDQLVEPADALQAIGQAAAAEPAAITVLDQHVMVGLRPVMTNKHTHLAPPGSLSDPSPRRPAAP